MHFEVNAKKLNQALKSIVALGSFVKTTKSDDANPCLVTAKDDVITIEAADYGFYVKHTLEAAVKKGGTFGVSAMVLSRCRFSETMTLKKGTKRNTVQVSSGSFRYVINELPKAENLITTGIPSRKSLRVKYLASMAADTFKTLIGTTSFKPGLKEESLRVQMEFQKKRKAGSVTITGLDSYSFARMKAVGQDIKVKKPFKAILKTSLLNNVLKELDVGNVSDEEIGSGPPLKIGMVYDLDNNPSLIRFTTEEFDLFYPVLSIPFDDVSFVLKKFANEDSLDCSFVTQKSSVQDAIGAVTALVGSDSIVINFKVSRKGIVVTTQTDNSKSRTELAAEEVHRNQKSTVICVHSGYFVNFVNLAPEIVPIKIESCGKAYVRISALELESSSIEFLVSQANPN